MKIGIDIDDTSFITVNSMIKYADKYDIEELGRKGINKEFGLIKNRYYLKILYGWDDKEKFDFFDMYYKNVLEECVLMPNVDKVCQKLKAEGDSLYFITARLTNIKNCNAEEITRKSLLDNNIVYDELIVNANDKIKISKEKGIDLFIEDSYETCVELEKLGIKSILMTTRMNQDIDSENITRVHNWNEVYKQIKNIKSKV